MHWENEFPSTLNKPLFFLQDFLFDRTPLPPLRPQFLYQACRSFISTSNFSLMFHSRRSARRRGVPRTGLVSHMTTAGILQTWTCILPAVRSSLLWPEYPPNRTLRLCIGFDAAFEVAVNLTLWFFRNICGGSWRCVEVGAEMCVRGARVC